MTAASAASAPPIVHAIGGSLGSALAVLLFYPLERARIELQAQASTSPTHSRRTSFADDDNGVDVDENQNQKQNQTLQKWQEQNQLLRSELESVEVEIQQQTAMEQRSENFNFVEFRTDDGDGDGGNDYSIHQASSSPSSDGSTSSSWMELQRDCSEDEKIILSDPLKGNSSPAPDDGSESTARKGARLGLFECLLGLHSRGALYQGVTPVISTIFTSQFIFFFINAYVKHLIKRTFANSSGENQRAYGAVLSLISSCLAGVGNVLLTTPLWVVNMAIVTGQTETSSLWIEFFEMVKARGIRHMWNGTSASLLLVSNPVIQFFCYEQIKAARLASGAGTNLQPKVLRPLEAFAAGAIAKTIATVTTYPLQLAQTVLRLKGTTFKGTLDCLIQLYQRGGVEEWYTGMRAKLLQTVLTSAFTFLTYEQILGAVYAALVKSGRLRSLPP